MTFAIKAEISDPEAETFAFGEQRGNRFLTDRTGNFIQEEDYTAFGASMSPVSKRSTLPHCSAIVFIR